MKKKIIIQKEIRITLKQKPKLRVSPLKVPRDYFSKIFIEILKLPAIKSVGKYIRKSYFMLCYTCNVPGRSGCQVLPGPAILFRSTSGLDTNRNSRWCGAGVGHCVTCIAVPFSAMGMASTMTLKVILPYRIMDSFH